MDYLTHGRARAVGGPDEITQRALLAKIRHDLRTPINAIIGYSELILEDADDECRARCGDDLEHIHAAGVELAEIVGAILNPPEDGADSTDDVDFQQIGAELRHAMLTPINTVIGYSEMLFEDAGEHDERFRSDIQRIHDAAERFLTSVGDLLNFQQFAHDPHVGTDAPSMIAEVVSSIRSLDDQASEGWSRYGPVLVVDDSDVNRDILARRLNQSGLQVATATNGREALDMLGALHFDLVLLDIMMPIMNGLEVLRQIKASPNLRDIPVIMISALDETDSVVRCLEIGAEDYLSKPFNPVVLNARIGACLEKKRLRDAEVEYLRNVNAVTAAAGAVESGRFDPDSLLAVAARDDELGQLARVFQRMAHEVAAREQRLKQQVEELRIEIDEAKKQQQIAEITESDAFLDILERARSFRSKT